MTPSHDTARPGRDPALDLLRTIALARVVLWHLFAAGWMTAFAAMPLMFFVAGTLLVDDDGQVRSYGRLLARRGRRILVPLWAYGAAVLGATLVHAGQVGFPGSSDDVWRALTWVVPVVDPADSPWHGGWLANHLWYLRAYLWVLLLAPALAAMSRRLVVAVPLFLVAVAQLEVASLFELPALGGGTARVLIGDAVTYGFFVVLGMAYRARRRAPAAGGLLMGAAAMAGAAVWYVAEIGLPPGGINASYPAIVLTGLAWVLLAGAAERPLRSIATVPWVAAVSRATCRRAVTIYLWHPAAIVVAYAAVGDREPARPFALAGLTVAIALVATAAVGWIEETGGRLRLRLPGIRLAAGVAAAAVALAVAVPTLVVPTPEASAAGGSLVPPPSYREALANSAFSGTLADQSKPIRLLGGRMPAKALQRALDEWMASRTDINSIAVAVTVDGKTWSGEAHRRGAPRLTRDEDRYATASLTKAFTTALVLREVEAGRLGLDAPVPYLPGVGAPGRRTTLTPRHLLQHTSGLVDYVYARNYRGDRPLTPQAAVALALRTRTEAPPGVRVNYANVNYLYLGLLLEHVTGRPYAELVADLVRPLRLAKTAVDAPGRPGWAGFSSGGVMSTVAELSRYGEALFTPGRVLPPHWVDALLTLDHHNLGMGTWPMCPCGTDAGGVKRYTAIGQHVGHGGLYYYPGQMTIAVHMEPGALQSIPHHVASVGDALRAVFRR